MAELELQEDQANDALHVIHIVIGEKSFQFRKSLCPAKSKVQKTWSWDMIKSAHKHLTEKRVLYNHI